jgi:starch-binding outer membrane protein, SusD/RagB family
MKRFIKQTFFIAILLLFVFPTGCKKLEVENLNEPNMEDVLASPNDVRSVVQSSFLSYWQAIKQYNIGMTAHVAADHSTVSWGNFGWRDNSEEPRTPWNNDPSYNDADMTQNVYYDLYAVISQVNDALVAILINEMEIGPNGADNPMIEATAYFIRGIAFGQLGLTFDQAMLPYHDSDLTGLEFQPWNEILEAAVEELKNCATLCENNTFNWGAGAVSGINIDNNYLKQLANSYAARFLALGARTKEANDQMNWTSYTWNDVLNFTNSGITTDFAPEGEGLPWDGGSWWDLNIKYLRQPGWGRVDCRVVNLLDPVYPVRYPTNELGFAVAPPQVHPNLEPGQATSNDLRFTNDFQFLASNDFRPERGGWHFSHYRHSRYDYPETTSTEGLFMGESRGPLREFRAYDNELLKAEALARTGDVAGAAAILNSANLPRKDRGQLPDVNANLDDVLKAIFYERYIELFHNGYLISFCDMRRTDQLQWGTPLHYPVPGKELLALGLELYTYGGVGNADGVNTSKGGAWIYDEYHFTPSWPKP